MNHINIPRLRYEFENWCENCLICNKCVCGDRTYGFGICPFCALNMERAPEGTVVWLGLETWPGERLDRFWEKARDYARAYGDNCPMPELDFEALEAAIERMGTW